MDKHFDAGAAEARISALWKEADAFRAGANARVSEGPRLRREGAESFTIVIPPPNVTGSLHMGHALNNTLQDILIRWHRMRGFDTLWQPGQDHAGIATQMVVERQLAAEGNIDRRSMGREAFVEKVWEWKERSGGTILNQLERLGASCDWSRNRFTMDEGLSRAVLETFVKLYDEGLIYRDKRLVNWDPHFETAISDLEVENVEPAGHMWHFKYPLADGATYDYVETDEDGAVTLRETRDYISIATTRPETMLGDGAVAVHPDDARYAPIVGRLCEIPVGPKAHRRLIPIITDEYPDPDFGSGAVKITGAHDFNDYAVARRGGIPLYRLMDTKARMRDDGAPYAEAAEIAQKIARGEADLSAVEVDAINLVPDHLRGLDRYEARRRVVEEITAEGLAVMVPETDPRLGNVEAPAPEEGGERRALVPLVEVKKIMRPEGDRSKKVIEPMLTDQWFCDAKTLAKDAIEAVRSGETTFVPGNWDRTYYHWMENIEPWCISRQLWWGHRVPVWYGPSIIEGRSPSRDGQAALTHDPKRAFCARSESEVLAAAASYYGSGVELGLNDTSDITPEEGYTKKPNPGAVGLRTSGGRSIAYVGLDRDPDVLDTWFSSALWPFSTLGWPDETPELARYYPTDVLVTGFDIIFFWVARMMMMGEKLTGKAPFHTVYVHALVRDEHGKKMSKSLGNVIDPIELIDRYGADAVRFTLASMAAMGRDIKLAVSRVEGYRNFTTKLWNAARFAEMNECRPDPAFDPASPKRPVNRWIVTETVRMTRALDAALAEYRFDDAARAIYDHTWKTFCDWYVELAKPLLQGDDDGAKAETRATAAWALDHIVTCLHPFMPFVTEELWGQTGERDRLCCHAPWPELPDALLDERAAAEIAWTIRLIEGVRSLRAEMSVPAGAKLELVLTGHDAPTAMRLLRNAEMIQRLARLSEVAVADEAPAGSVVFAMEDCAVNLPLAGVIDIAAERARLDRELAKLDKDRRSIEGKLANEKFLAKAPEAVVDEQRERLAAAEAERARLEAARDRLAGLG
ncbi:MAG: valine--tRNA ligase [Paracoccaceae bacterium]